MLSRALPVVLLSVLVFGMGALPQVTPEEWASHFGVSPRGIITAEELPFISFIPGLSTTLIGRIREALPITSADQLGGITGIGDRWVTFFSALYTFEGSVATTETADVPDFVFTEPAQVIYIVDGDTFDVEWPDYDYTLRIRPASINTPERGHCYFDEAKRYAEAILLDRWVWLDPGDPTTMWDVYGRLVAKVWLDSTRTASFGHIMVSQGYARVMTQFPRGRELDALGLEAEAQAAERGLWGECQ